MLGLDKLYVPLLVVVLMQGLHNTMLRNKVKTLEVECELANQQVETLVITKEAERKAFIQQIEELNTNINKYKLDLASTQQTIADKEKQLVEERIKQEALVEQELQHDASSDKQLDIMKRILHDFSDTAGNS